MNTMFCTVKKANQVPALQKGWVNSANFNGKFSLVDAQARPVGPNFNGPKYILIAQQVHPSPKANGF